MLKRVGFLLWGMVSLLSGFALYLLFRENSYISKLFAQWDFLEMLREYASVLDCAFLRYYFPDFLWGFSLGCGLQSLFVSGKKSRLLCGMITFLCGSLWELLQLLGIVSGTADVLDIIMYLLASLLCMAINIEEKNV